MGTKTEEETFLAKSTIPTLPKTTTKHRMKLRRELQMKKTKKMKKMTKWVTCSKRAMKMIAKTRKKNMIPRMMKEMATIMMMMTLMKRVMIS